MSYNFVPSWVNLKDQVEPKQIFQRNSKHDKDIECIISTDIKLFMTNERVDKFLELCGLRPCYKSKEYMEWAKDQQKNLEAQPSFQYWKKLYDSKKQDTSNNVDYNDYNHEDFYDEGHIPDEENEYIDYSEIDRFVNIMSLEDEYQDEYYKYLSDDESSDEDDEDDYYDTGFNKYYL